MEKMQSNKIVILFFMLPALVVFGVVLPIPILQSICYGFFKWDAIGEMKFIGLDNYIRLFTIDPVFKTALKNTFIFTIASVILQLPPAMFFAVILSSGIRGNKFLKSVYFLPVTISGVAVGLLWQFIYHPQIGMLNGLLSLFTDQLANKTWLADANFSLYAVIISVAWQWTGYHMVLYISAITTIPGEILESAEVDGVTKVGAFRYITFPLLKPIIKVSFVLIITSSIKAFDSVFALTNGGPAHSSEVLALRMYNTAFQQTQYGYGSAISVILFILCILFTILLTRLFVQDNT